MQQSLRNSKSKMGSGRTCRSVSLDPARIRHRLSTLGRRREWLSVRLAVSHSTIQRALNGRPVSRLLAAAISRVLKVRLDELLLADPPPLADTAKGEARVA